MSRVFVLDQEKRPVMPCTPARARLLLDQHKAAVWRRFPFTIILRQSRSDVVVEPLRLKMDPGSQVTGITIVNDVTGAVVAAEEICHRSRQIKTALDNRRIARQSRRKRHTRYRQPRFSNRCRSAGWLPPSLQSRITNVLTWVGRLRRLCPIGALSLEWVKFDVQLLENPEIHGIEYQQGTLMGYEIREYLLERWQHRCAYRGKTSSHMQVEHVVPKTRGGTDRISNLVLACEPCNQRKGNQTAEEFGYPNVQASVKATLRDAAAVNTTRYALFNRLVAAGLPIERGTGGLTKRNRIMRDLPKTHWLDAACVGESTPIVLHVRNIVPLRIFAMGRQRRQMCLMDEHGFPRTQPKRLVGKHGFRTGDIVRAVVPANRKASGVHVGRAAVKADGRLTIATRQGSVPDVSYRYCALLQRSDGYNYMKGGAALSGLA